jgi:hypothetical protein
MTIALAAALVGDDVPLAVQLSATGLTIASNYTIQGTLADGTIWIVRGGNEALADSTQIILYDVATPINVPITYQVLNNAAVVASATPLTVTYTGQVVLNSINGDLTAGFTWMNNDAPRSMFMRSNTFQIPGRLLPVVRFDVSGGETGEILAETTEAQSADMRTLLQAGGLAILRTDGAVQDVAPVQFVLITGVSSSLLGIGTLRRWNLSYQVVGDPQPDVAVAAITWDDFDVAYSALTWANFDTEWSALSWADFDATDWVNH